MSDNKKDLIKINMKTHLKKVRKLKMSENSSWHTSTLVCDSLSRYVWPVFNICAETYTKKFRSHKITLHQEDQHMQSNRRSLNNISPLFTWKLKNHPSGSLDFIPNPDKIMPHTLGNAVAFNRCCVRRQCFRTTAETAHNSPHFTKNPVVEKLLPVVVA